MRLPQKIFSMDNESSTTRITFAHTKIRAVLAAASMGYYATLHGAEIHDAAEKGNLEKVKACLVQDSKQINSADAKGRTVLVRAAIGGKKEIVNFLLEQGATEDIFVAAMVGHTEKVAALLKQDPQLLNARDRSGKAALHWAAFHGQLKVVELLLAEKANVNLLDGEGFTPLHWAVMFNKRDVVEVLLANKADTTIKVARFGWTPLRLAVIHGHRATAEVLLKNGADPNLEEEDQIPVLHQAVICGRIEMIELLLANKAAINAQDSEGDTPMDEAVEVKRKDILDLLRQHGGKMRPAR